MREGPHRPNERGYAMLAVVAGIGVMAAVYLEEFAPKNNWTDVIEVNINNLAAVPSIVYGLLGLGLFINTLGVPRSSPLLGGLVLALMALPTVSTLLAAAVLLVCRRKLPPTALTAKAWTVSLTLKVPSSTCKAKLPKTFKAKSVPIPSQSSAGVAVSPLLFAAKTTLPKAGHVANQLGKICVDAAADSLVGLKSSNSSSFSPMMIHAASCRRAMAASCCSKAGTRDNCIEALFS